jgi:hypothetical protein
MSDDLTTLQVEDIPPQENGEPTLGEPAVEPTKLGYEELGDLLGIAHPDSEQLNKLQFIWDHFSKGRDRIDALEAIKATQRTMSQPEIGESYLHQLFTYTRLLSTVRDAQREMKVYEGNNKLDNPRKEV